MTSSNFSPQKGGVDISPSFFFFFSFVCVCGAKINHCHCVELFERTTGWERVVQFFSSKGGKKGSQTICCSFTFVGSPHSPPPPSTETE